MKTHAARMRTLAVGALALMALALAPAAQADPMIWVTVGDPGNTGDLSRDGAFYADGLGNVSNTYRIGKTEVMNDEYAEFLNKKAAADPNGLYNPNMGSDARGGITQSGTSGSFTYALKTNMGNKPVNYVSWYDALRFANWMHNGRGAGDTEDGAYLMSLGSNVVRKAGAKVFLPTADEWHKAAYYKGGGTTAGYWEYATQTDAVPAAVTAVDTVGPTRGNGVNYTAGNSANWSNSAAWNGQTGNVTTARTSGHSSFYGTVDQNGNVSEWEEETSASNPVYRTSQGGSWAQTNDLLKLVAGLDPTTENGELGFRMAARMPPIVVQNGSFEEASGWQNNIAGSPTFGQWYYDPVEIADVERGGYLEGTLAINAIPPNPAGTLAPNQPTGQGGRPRNWTYTGNIITDNVAWDARWPGVWSSWTVGPTDGRTAIILDNRSWDGAVGADQAAWVKMKQTLSLNVGQLKALGSIHKLLFDAREREGNDNANPDDPDGDSFIQVYFEVDGVQDVAGTWETRFDATRKVRTFSAINGSISLTYYSPTTAAKDNPGVPKYGMVGPQNMDTFFAMVDLSVYTNDGASVAMVIYNSRFKDGAATCPSGRVYMDNVRVETVGATISVASGDWHDTNTWETLTVPVSTTPVIVNTHTVTVTTATAYCYNLTVSGGGSVSATGQSLNVASSIVTALNTTGGTLALDAASTLNIARAGTSNSFAGLTVATGTVLNITGELTVDADKDLSGATINTPKVTLAGGTLTKSDGLTIGSGGLIGGNGTVAGTVAVAGGGKVGPGTDTTIATITAAGLTLAGGSLLTLNAASTSSNDQITVSTNGGLTIAGGAITFLDGAGTGPQTGLGTYNIIGYSGAITGDPANLYVQNRVSGRKYTFGAAGGFVTLTVAQSAYWNGGGTDALWSNSTNWSGVAPVTGDILPFASAGAGGAALTNDIAGGSYATLQFESEAPAFTLNGNSVTLTGDPGGNVVINNSANTQTVNLPVTFGADAAINAVGAPVVFGSTGTIDNAGFNLAVKGAQAVTLNGAITGGGGVTATNSGAGALNLTGTNSYTGTTTVEAGMLAIGGAGQLGGGNYAGSIGISNSCTFTYNSSAAQTLAGTISGGGALTKSGASTLTLSGANTYTGATTVAAGTLNLSTNGSLGATAVTVSANTNQPVLKISGSYTIGTPTAGTLTVSGGAVGSQGILSLVDGTVNTLTLTNNSAGVDVFTIGSTNASQNSILNMEVGATSDKIVVGAGASRARLLANGRKTVVNITGLGNLSGLDQTLIYAPGGVGTTNSTRVSFTNAFELGTVSGNLGGCTVALGSDSNHLYLIETRVGTVFIVR